MRRWTCCRDLRILFANELELAALFPVRVHMKKANAPPSDLALALSRLLNPAWSRSSLARAAA